MSRKGVWALAALVVLAALSTSMVALAGNEGSGPSVRGEPVGDACTEGGPGTASEDGQEVAQGCHDTCRREYQQCLERAKADYEKLLEDCRRIDDPMGRAACFKASAEAYQEMIKACKAAFEACLEACGRGR
ncbi:MAG: hypothetical protein AABY30_01005 [Candidatus Thermoplasmatota archaeon]